MLPADLGHAETVRAAGEYAEPYPNDFFERITATAGRPRMALHHCAVAEAQTDCASALAESLSLFEGLKMIATPSSRPPLPETAPQSATYRNVCRRSWD